MDKVKEIYQKLVNLDDSSHIEKMCELEEKLRQTLDEKQTLFLNTLLNMHAAHEQRAGKLILFHEILSQDNENIIKACPRCGSEDISIKGLAWIQVSCNECNFLGRAHSYGSRKERYDQAIKSWNSGYEGNKYK